MMIEKLKIKNFRGIECIEFPQFDRHINIFVGANGAGKSSTLDALSYILSWFLARLKNPKSNGTLIAESDIKTGSKSGCILSVSIRNGGEWILHRSKSYNKKKADAPKSELQDLMNFVERTHTNIEHGENAPVVMYYPVDRAIHNAPAHLKRGDIKTEIWDVYENALKGNTEFRSFFEWYRRQEDSENEHIRDNRDYRDRKLSTIRRAIRSFFPNFDNLRVRRNPQRFVINKGDETIEFDQLSQGEKCYLALVCDLARRFAIACPNLENPLEGEGVVMIDEVDLHLHPTWQMEVVGKLTTIFPNCQFFLTTHSPHVLSEVHPHQIFSMEHGHISTTAYNPFGKLVNDILANYFSISMPRNVEVKNKIEAAYDALQNNDEATFTNLFEELVSILGKTDPDMVRLKLESVRNAGRDHETHL